MCAFSLSHVSPMEIQPSILTFRVRVGIKLVMVMHGGEHQLGYKNAAGRQTIVIIYRGEFQRRN